MSDSPQISDEDFAALVRLIEDGELDDKMPDLEAAMNERKERRKGEILRLVQSVWGKGATVTEEGSAPNQSSPAQAPQPNPDVSNVLPGHYLAQDGKHYPIPGTSPSGAQIPTPTPDVMSGQWPTPINAQAQSGDLGVSPVRDPMATGSDPFGDRNPDIVSTGAQIG